MFPDLLFSPLLGTDGSEKIIVYKNQVKDKQHTHLLQMETLVSLYFLDCFFTVFGFALFSNLLIFDSPPLHYFLK